LSAGWIDAIELTGDLIWLDDTRKRGGLRFGQLPEAVRKQIQEWVRKPERPSPQVRESAPVVPAKDIQPTTAAGHSFVGDRTSPSSPRRNQPDPGSAGPASAPVSGPPRFSPDPRPPVGAPKATYPPLPLIQWGSMGGQALEESVDASRRKQRLGAIALVVAVLLLVASVGVFAFLNRREAGESLIRLGEELSGEHAQQPAKSEASATPSSIGRPASESALPANPAGANGPPSNVRRDSQVGALAGSNASDSSAYETHQSAEAKQAGSTPRAEGAGGLEAPSSSAQPEPKNSTMKSASPSSEAFPEGDGHKELALARQYLRGTGVPQNRAAAAHLLWVAVGLGNYEAELELADLYLQREGAPGKNCEQARILLTAASHSGNPVAGQKLAELHNHGCR
jgi:hypothetical protein